MENNLLPPGDRRNEWNINRDDLVKAAEVAASKERLEYEPDRYFDDERLKNNVAEVLGNEDFAAYYEAYWKLDRFVQDTDPDLISEFMDIEKPADFFKLAVNRGKRDKYEQFSRLTIKKLEASLAIKSKKKGGGILPVAANYAKLLDIIFD